MSEPAAFAVAEHFVTRVRRTWSTAVVSSFVQPVIFLTALGLGLGQLIDGGEASAGLGGLSYAEFVGPALMAASAMQVGAQESSWPVLGAVKWHFLYHAITSTPARPVDVAVGHVLYVGLRVGVQSTMYVVVLAVAGIATSPMAVLAVPVAVLCGMAFASLVSAWTVTLDSDLPLAALHRFGIQPMFMFSGTFFPLAQLPDPLEWLARLVPLWHAVVACRALVAGTADLSTLGHVAVLAALVVVGLAVGGRTYARRLTA